MKALASLLVFPLTILVKLVSAMLSNLAGLITCRRVMRKTELTSRDLPPLSPPGTPSEARKIMGEPPMQAFALYLRNYWRTRFLILAGLINGILGGLGIMLQDGGIWFPLCLLMALFTFLEMMIFITGRKESLRELAEADPDSRANDKLVASVGKLVPRYGLFREEALRAVGGPGKTIIIASLALAALLIGLQADWYLRPREKEPGVWQLAGFQYRVLDDGTAEVIRYTGPWKKIRVPSSLHGAPVTSVGEKAFYCPSGDYLPFARKELEEIALPPTLRRIGERAFWGCGYLRSLTLPDGVTRIGTEAFADCSFTSFHIPAGVTEIGGCPFPKNLKTLTVAEDNPVYGLWEGALCGRDGVLIWVSKATVGSEYRVPDGIRRIGDRVFSDCGRLERVYLPEGLTGIGRYAFSYCDSLEEIIFPDTVTSIGDNAFMRCRRLSGVDLPADLTHLGIGAFENCESITRAHIPAGLTEISQSAFDGCTALTDVVIPEGVTCIRLCAFKDCAGLKRVTIPSSVRDMDYYALFAPNTVWVVTPGSFAETHAALLGAAWEYAEITPAEPAGVGI